MHGFNVLLVDDEVDFLEVLVERLKMRQVNTEGVSSGEDALNLLDKRSVDVVVLDVKMPGMDGIETLRKIKMRYPLIEVIMLTGMANMQMAIQGMELGAFDYLIKPTGMDELLHKIQDAYEKKGLHEIKIKEIKAKLGQP